MASVRRAIQSHSARRLRYKRMGVLHIAVPTTGDATALGITLLTTETLSRTMHISRQNSTATSTLRHASPLQPSSMLQSISTRDRIVLPWRSSGATRSRHFLIPAMFHPARPLFGRFTLLCMSIILLWSASRYVHLYASRCTSSLIVCQVHLPGQHLVLFNPDEDVHALLERGANETSRLTAFFRACADPALGPIASQYTYQEFPRHFVFEEKSKRWKLRKQGTAIGRLYFVSPTAGERFYLRSLLSIVRGPRSFEDLLTYQGRRHSTFREVCLARGLLEDDGEWSQCLEEASHMQTGSQLRMLFAMLLIFCNPTHPDRLWMRFRVHICDDLRWRLQNIPNFANPSDKDVYDYGLFCLNQLLAEHGRNLRNFPPMPCPV
jgi:hypothetical protein